MTGFSVSIEGLAGLRDRLSEAAGKKSKEIVEDFHGRVLARTPVNTGEALAGMQMSMSENGNTHPGPVGPQQIPTPTSVGGEANRPAAEAIAMASSDGLDFTKAGIFWMVNKAEHAADLENGIASPRSQNMVQLAVLETANKFNEG